jgi:hypothetical protein
MQVWKGTQFSFNWLRLVSYLPDQKTAVGALIHFYDYFFLANFGVDKTAFCKS